MNAKLWQQWVWVDLDAVDEDFDPTGDDVQLVKDCPLERTLTGAAVADHVAKQVLGEHGHEMDSTGEITVAVCPQERVNDPESWEKFKCSFRREMIEEITGLQQVYRWEKPPHK